MRRAFHAAAAGFGVIALAALVGLAAFLAGGRCHTGTAPLAKLHYDRLGQ